MKYFRVSQFNGLSGAVFGVEYTQNNGESWVTVSVHNTHETANEEMGAYVATHEGCSLLVTVTDITGTELTPNHPELCKGNGKTLNESGEVIECCCDECDFFSGCFRSDTQPA